MKQGTITLAQLKNSAPIKSANDLPAILTPDTESIKKPKQNDKKIAREARARRFALIKELRKLLHTTYPDIFDYMYPKPLAIGIHRDIKAAFPQFSQLLIRKFLGRWVKDQRYLSEVLNSTVRSTLEGKEKSIITADEKRNAHQLLEKQKESSKV